MRISIYDLRITIDERVASTCVTLNTKRRCKESELNLRPKRDKIKMVLALRLRKETIMTLKWIAERLQKGAGLMFPTCWPIGMGREDEKCK
jgi:hypothetical protein